MAAEPQPLRRGGAGAAGSAVVNDPALGTLACARTGGVRLLLAHPQHGLGCYHTPGAISTAAAGCDEALRCGSTPQPWLVM